MRRGAEAELDDTNHFAGAGPERVTTRQKIQLSSAWTVSAKIRVPNPSECLSPV